MSRVSKVEDSRRQYLGGLEWSFVGWDVPRHASIKGEESRRKNADECHLRWYSCVEDMADERLV